MLALGSEKLLGTVAPATSTGFLGYLGVVRRNFGFRHKETWDTRSKCSEPDKSRPLDSGKRDL